MNGFPTYNIMSYKLFCLQSGTQQCWNFFNLWCSIWPSLL